MPRRDFEIIIADNGSACGVHAVRSAAPGARVIEAPARGAGPARNAGAMHARGRVLAFTDSDCKPDPGWLMAGADAIENGADIAGGSVQLSVSDPARPAPAESFEKVFAFDNGHYIEVKGFSVTANLFVRRSVFARVGPFAAGLPEDLDWCRRARGASFRITYVPEARILHPARQTYADLREKWNRLTREAYADYAAEQGSGARWLMRAAAVFVSPLGHAWRVIVSPHLGTWRERMGALWILGCIRIHRACFMVTILRAQPLSSHSGRAGLSRIAKA